jgi:asparagine synthase (glutamine-hydrolysing)
MKKIRPSIASEFTTDSDCEILLHLYKENGPGFLTDFFINGMFAFILYDECKDTYVVARDPIGIIPLYVG